VRLGRCLAALCVEVIVGKHLLVRRHPVSETKEENRRVAERVDD